MKGFLKIYSLFVVAVVVFSIVMVFLIKDTNTNFAQAQPYEIYKTQRGMHTFCDEPIPIGEAYEALANLLNDVYVRLQDVRHFLDLSKQRIKAELADLSVNENEVCNFKECTPHVIDVAPSFSFDMDYYFGKKTLAGVHIPNCQPKECVGNPCPDMEVYIEDLRGLRDGIKGAYLSIKSYFEDPSILVTNDIREPGDSDWLKITRPEFIRRKLKLSRMWLEPNHIIQGKRACALTKEEYEDYKRGEGEMRYPLNCVQAFKQKVYWPRLWSKNCQKECLNISSKSDFEDCLDCVVNNIDSRSSSLAKIGYKINFICKDYCKDGFTKDCYNCICCPGWANGTCSPEEVMNEQDCLAWLCGGSEDNWVCCHNIPLEQQK